METKTRRNDLIDMMVDAMTSDMTSELSANEHAGDQFEEDSKLDHKAKGGEKHLDEMIIVSTAMLILIAGYDTTAQTLSYLG